MIRAEVSPLGFWTAGEQLVNRGTHRIGKDVAALGAICNGPAAQECVTGGITGNTKIMREKSIRSTKGILPEAPPSSIPIPRHCT